MVVLDLKVCDSLLLVELIVALDFDQSWLLQVFTLEKS